MQDTRNKALVLRFIQEFQNDGDLDSFHELMHPDFVDHSRPPGVAPGPEGVLQQFAAFRAVLSDFRVDVVLQVAQGELVATHKTFSGVHSGEFLGIPASGQRIAVPVSDMLRIRDGRIAEHWGVLSLVPLLTAAASAPGA